MTLRARIVAALAVLTALATTSVGVLSHRATSARLRVEVDRSLDDAARDLLVRRRDPAGPMRPRRGPDVVAPAPVAAAFDLVVVQVVQPDGATLVAPEAPPLPVQAADRALAAGVGPRRDVRRDVVVAGERYRLLTVGLPAGGALQVARSLAETERLLASLRARILGLVLLVSASAAALGWVVARQVTQRLVTLTHAAQRVADTGRMDVDVPVDGTDEAGRLGAAFAGMLAALARSRDDQQRLVQDAGHELRTPLTSLRTNVAVLRQGDRLSAQDRARLLDDLEGETRELTDLVNELVALAADERADEPTTDVLLGGIASRVAERARRRTGREVVVDADDVPIRARGSAVERAIANLVDNALKFADTGEVEVVVRCGHVEVRDRGPGVDPDDRSRVFDRFYRADSARGRPGSGLGLSIVRSVAESHGGTVFVRPRDGGGSVIGFALPPD